MEEQKLTLSFSYNKKVLVTIITILGTALTQGIPQTINQIKLFLCLVVGISLTYIVQDIIYPADSQYNTLNWRQYLTAFLMAVSAALSDWVGNVWDNTVLDWKSLLFLILTTSGTYLFKAYKSYNPTS